MSLYVSVSVSVFLSENILTYKWFDNVVKLKLPITELMKEHFNNRLKSDEFNNHEWEYVQQLIKDLNITTFEEFHDF